MLFLPAILAAQAPAPAAPHMVFDAMHFDFGKISPDASVTHVFKVANDGKAYLNITHLNPSCGCTSTVLGKWSLAPGESTQVVVTFNPKGYHGVARKSIQVTSDDPANPNQTLTFEAEVIRDITPSRENVFFMDVLRTVPRKDSIKLESTNGQPVQIIDIKANDAPWLTFSYRQTGLDAVVDIALDGRKLPVNQQQGASLLNITTTNAKVGPISIAVQWDLKPMVTAEPVRVAWVGPAGVDRSMTVTLKHRDGKPFRILAVKPSNPIIKVDLGDNRPAPSHAITVKLGADIKAATYMERLLLTLDDPDQPELEVRVSATLR
jgi:hypothetical protein